MSAVTKCGFIRMAVTVIVLAGSSASVALATVDVTKTPPDPNSRFCRTSPLRTGLKCLGVLRNKTTGEIKSSNWSIDGCPVDRDYVDFDKYCDYLPSLGIKKIRILTGWAKSERKKGTIDVAWIDHIVGWCQAHAMEVILELSYGNPAYEGGGGPGLADGIPDSPEGLAAWDRWVEFLARHFSGRVREWSMWNEPDNLPKPGKKRLTPDEIAAFNVRCAKILRAHIPHARIHGLSLAYNDPAFLEECLRAMGEDVRLFDTFIYHGYAQNPDTSYANVIKQKAVVAKYAPQARLRQGENGCSSDFIDRLSLCRIPWSEYSQAKWDMRRMLGDLGHDVESSVFGIVDINYAPPAHPYKMCNRKGLLRTNESNDVIRVKRAYQAVRNVVSVFDDTVRRVRKPGISTSDRSLALYEYQDAARRPIFVFWEKGRVNWDDKTNRLVLDPASRPSDGFSLRPVVFDWNGTPLDEPVWVDLLTGRVYELPAEAQIVHSCGVAFADVPVYDSPCLLTERSVLDFVPEYDNSNTKERKQK